MGCCGHIVKMIWPNRNDLISAPWLISHFVLWQCSDARPGGTKWPVKWRLMQFDFRVIRCRARTRQKCREREMERERKRKRRGANCFQNYVLFIYSFWNHFPSLPLLWFRFTCALNRDGRGAGERDECLMVLDATLLCAITGKRCQKERQTGLSGCEWRQKLEGDLVVPHK